MSHLMHELQRVRAQQYMLSALPAIQGTHFLQVSLLQENG